MSYLLEHDLDKDLSQEMDLDLDNRSRLTICTTKNTEYHLADGFCILVRDLETGRQYLEHPAEGEELLAIVDADGKRYRLESSSFILTQHRLLFTGFLITSPVQEVRYPPEDNVIRLRQATDPFDTTRPLTDEEMEIAA